MEVGSKKLEDGSPKSGVEKMYRKEWKEKIKAHGR